MRWNPSKENKGYFIESLFGWPTNSDTTMDILVGHEESKAGIGISCDEMLKGLDPTDRAIFVLYHKWEFNFYEIGDLFGVSQTRVYERYTRIKGCLSDRVLKEKSSLSGKVSGGSEGVEAPEQEKDGRLYEGLEKTTLDSSFDEWLT